MPTKRTIIWLILLSVFVVLVTGISIFNLSAEQLSSYGSIIAAAGSLLAVIWFTGSLWYQSQQLKEQRIQFLAQFKQLSEDGRRNALVLARDILKTTESRALGINPEITSLNQLSSLYLLNLVELKNISESNDVEIVKAAIERWGKIEGPANVLMNGLKSAAKIYFTAIGKEDIDYSNEPEVFVLVYGQLLWELPFFEEYRSSTTPLAEFMMSITPGRKAVIIASLAVMAKMTQENFVKMDAVREDIRKHIEKGYPLPKIAEGL